MILGQQDHRHPGAIIRLLAGEPEELRRGEARHGGDAGDAAEIRDGPVQRFGVGGGAPVIPQDRRPDHMVRCVEEDGTMHLAGKADRLHLAPGFSRIAAQMRERAQGRLPPDFGILFRPERPWMLGRHRFAGMGERCLGLIDEQRLDRGGSDVEADEGHQCVVASGGGFIAPVMIATASDIEKLFGSMMAMRLPSR